MAHFVLVAGEHWKVTTGEHNMGTNHCSMEHVGTAFDSLRAAGVPRERIIVIAQIEERRDWLRRAIVSGEPRCTSVSVDEEEAAGEASRRIYRCMLAALEESCGGIIREGGADYDAADVNPETVFNVLTAALSDRPPQASGRIVPRDCHGIALMIYSHGCSHETAPLDGDYYRQLLATIPCDVCGKTHTQVAVAAEATASDHEHVSLRTSEWYIHLPHNAPSAAQAAMEKSRSAVPNSKSSNVDPEVVAAYEGIAHSEHPHPYSLLYWQILFRIYHKRFSATPSTPMLVLLNSCRSGGLSKFLEQEIADRTYGVHNWPLCVMSSSQAERDTVVGGLWTSWFKELDTLDPPRDANVDPDENLAVQAPITVSKYFDQVAANYSNSHSYDLTNRLIASWQAPAWQNRADRDGFVASVRRACLPRGRIDYAALRTFVREHNIQLQLNCVHCNSFSRGESRDGPGGGLLCSSCERDWVRAGHTQPPSQPVTVHEGQAAVDHLIAAAKEAEQAIARPWAWFGARSNFRATSLSDFLFGRRQHEVDERGPGRRSCPAIDVSAKRRCLAIDQPDQHAEGGDRS